MTAPVIGEDHVNEVVALALVLLLASCGYAAGRLHGQFGYRSGYRFGYRQGYFDGDRASWTRRRRDLQAAVASVLQAPSTAGAAPVPGARTSPDPGIGTTYTSATLDDAEDFEDFEEFERSEDDGGRHAVRTVPVSATET